MAKQIGSNRTPKFNAEEFLENFEREQREEIRKRNTIPEGSIDGNPWDGPPAPGMTFNAGIWKWVPAASVEKKDSLNWNPDETPDIRRPGYSITGKKLPDDAELTNQSGNQGSDQSPKSDSEQVTIMTKTELTPKSETSEPDEPQVNKPQPKVSTMRKKTEQTKVKEGSKASDNPSLDTEKKADALTDAIIATDVTEMGTIGKADSRSKDSEDSPSAPKATRVSAKMRRASRKEFHDTYLVKTDTKGGKPITIAADLLERAYRICARSGDYRTCPTYLFNNLLREVLDAIEPDTEDWATLD